MDLLLNEVVIGATVYLLLTLVFTSRFIQGKFDKVHKEIEEVKSKADARDDENEAYIRRLEVILQVYLQRSLSFHDSFSTEIKRNTELD